MCFKFLKALLLLLKFTFPYIFILSPIIGDLRLVKFSSFQIYSFSEVRDSASDSEDDNQYGLAGVFMTFTTFLLDCHLSILLLIFLTESFHLTFAAVQTSYSIQFAFFWNFLICCVRFSLSNLSRTVEELVIFYLCNGVNDGFVGEKNFGLGSIAIASKLMLKLRGFYSDFIINLF